MIEIRGAVIELKSASPERLATFYESLAGLERSASSSQEVTLRGGGLTLRIRRGAEEEERGGPVFGFLLAAGADLAAARAHAVSCGAVVLTEAKREGAHSLVCSDPDGYEFTLAAERPESSATSLAPAERAAPARVVEPPEPRPAEPTRITRRDLDRLSDMARLAEMQESIAGLHQPFTADDPATALEEMRSKLGPRADPRALELEEAQAQAGARELEIARDELLERYKKQLLSQGETNKPAGVKPPAPGPLESEESFGFETPRRTLGGAPDTEEES